MLYSERERIFVQRRGTSLEEDLANDSGISGEKREALQ
jgi:hypothetical protein